jgi:FkbM family methyltransferase
MVHSSQFGNSPQRVPQFDFACPLGYCRAAGPTLEYMVTIEQIDPPYSRPLLGQQCRFAARGDALAEVQYFLEHEGVIYPEPLVSDAEASIRVYLEAPGRYALHATWRSAHGASGRTRIEFHVAGASALAPQKIRSQGQVLWVPTAWDAQVLSSHEQTAFRDLEGIVRPGMTVYDIGANLGLYSTHFSRWIGSEGWLYAIEPNPICVSFLRANLERARVRNFSILPVAVASRRSDITFSINYGSSLIGVGRDAPGAGKAGHQIRVAGESLDALIATLKLRQPDFIKLDVEGAEASAVAGMMGTLEQSRPGFMIELHGREAAAATLRCLAPLGYQYLLSSTGARYPTADALLDGLPEACVQVIGQSSQ